MSITIDTLLKKLPPYRDKWVTLHERQTVKDIISEVLEAHEHFAPYYDKIALYFDSETVEGICDKLYRFLKKNIKYREETEDEQSSALPTGILTRGYGDCKHYSGFSGGVLDALRRSGKSIDWNYRFASYKILSSDPHHVFIVVHDPGHGKEFWIDPTPGAEKLEPCWITDKKIKIGTMALRRNISGITDSPQVFQDENIIVSSMGKASLVLTPFTGDNLNFDGSGHYANVFNPFLGISSYADYGGDRNLNINQVTDQLNQAIASGPAPGHNVISSFVQWVYDNSIRSWNFYYPGGVVPGFTALSLLPLNYPKWIVSDGHLMLDKPVAVDDYRNAEIHLLTAWAQSIINEQDPTPYPVTPNAVKEFSQGTRGDNFFNEPRGAGFFKDALEFVGKIGLAPIRNAFLGLVGINAFGMASKLHHALYNTDGSLDTAAADKIRMKWAHWDGDFNKFLNTVNHGAAHKAVLGQVEVPAAAVATAWIAVATAAIAAIMPIVKALLTTKQQRTGIDYNIDPSTQLPYPTIPTTTGSSSILNTIKSNPVPFAIGGAALYFLLSGKKKVSGLSDDTTLLVLGGAVLLLLLKNKPAVAV